MFKCFKKKVKTIFDMPADETKPKFEEMINLVYSIIGSDSYAELSSKTIVPLGSTQQDVAKLLKENAPKKVKQVLDMLLVDNFESIIKISALIFCQDYETYKKKSINEICNDYLSLSRENTIVLLNFFTRAGR